MGKRTKIIGLVLKLVVLVSLLAGCVFLLKAGIELLPNNGDVFTKLGLSSVFEADSNVVDFDVTFDEIYKAYKSNELMADDLYSGNRYRITATVKEIEGDGIFNLTGGATLSMTVEVGDDVVPVLAEFEKDQEAALKKVVVGDTVVFDGTCVSERAWMECKIVDGE